MCDEVQQQFARIKKIWVDSAYCGELLDYVPVWCRFMLEIVKRTADQKGFQVQPKRWIVERTLRWLNAYRRLSKDYKKPPSQARA